jgi:hypothetical protein
MKYKTLDEAIALQNGVPQGLSSAIMTSNLREAEKFLSDRGQRLRHCQCKHRNIRRRDWWRIWW